MVFDNFLGSYSIIWDSDFNPFSPQDIDSKHNLNNQKNAPAILQFQKALKIEPYIGYFKSLILTQFV